MNIIFDAFRLQTFQLPYEFLIHVGTPISEIIITQTHTRNVVISMHLIVY